LTLSPRPPRVSSRVLPSSPARSGNAFIGTKAAGRTNWSIPEKRSGATPTTVNSVPFTRTRRPTMAGSDPNWLAHVEYPSTATASRPGTASSSGRKPRPSAGVTPMTVKKLPLTSMPRRSWAWARASWAMDIVVLSKATRPLNDFAFSR
jgi:hypothetical protein